MRSPTGWSWKSSAAFPSRRPCSSLNITATASTFSTPPAIRTSPRTPTARLWRRTAPSWSSTRPRASSRRRASSSRSAPCATSQSSHSSTSSTARPAIRSSSWSSWKMSSASAPIRSTGPSAAGTISRACSTATAARSSRFRSFTAGRTRSAPSSASSRMLTGSTS